jgi:UDP-sulfoquinovose synthase
MEHLFETFKPECVIHYAEQPSAPYSMIGFDEARLTLQNNLGTTFNVIWAAIKHAPSCHIVKLGTMGEYGTPNIDIEEGWIEIEHKGRRDRFLYPRQAGSLYHTTKVLDTDLLWFYVRMYGLAVTDLMQGPVYGMSTPECDLDDRLLPHFHYDDIFGTVVNRFLVQAIAGVPMTVYGRGGQTRGYLNINDTLQCVGLAVKHPVKAGELRILNQFTEQLSVLEIAEKVRDAARELGVDASIERIPNPRREMEEHYYRAAHHGLIELGLEPHFMDKNVLLGLLRKIERYRDRINVAKILPRVKWNKV